MAMSKDAAKAFRGFLEMMMKEDGLPEELRNEAKIAFLVEDIVDIILQNFNPSIMTPEQAASSAEYLTLVKAGLENFTQQMKGEQNGQT